MIEATKKAKQQIKAIETSQKLDKKRLSQKKNVKDEGEESEEELKSLKELNKSKGK